MALGRIDHTDAQLAAANMTRSNDPGSVQLDADRTLAYWVETSASVPSTYVAVLSHPDAGGGSWGAKAQVGAASDQVKDAVLLDADTVLVVTYAGQTVGWKATIVTVSGTTCSVGSAQAFAAPTVTDPECIILPLSASKAVVLLRGLPWLAVLNFSGSTLTSEKAVDANRNPELMPTADSSDFEGGTGGWTVTSLAGNAAVIVGNSTDIAIEGTHSLKIQQSGLGATETRSPSGTSGAPVVAGHTYKVWLGYHVVSSLIGAGSDVLLSVDWYDSSGTFLSSSVVVSRSISGANNIYVAGMRALGHDGLVTAPANAAFAAVRVRTDQISNGSHTYLDSVSIRDANGRITSPQARRGELLLYWASNDLYAAVVSSAAADEAEINTPTLLRGSSSQLFSNAGRVRDNIAPVAGVLIAQVPTQEGAAPAEFRHFHLTVSGTSVSASEDPTVLQPEAQGDWSAIIDEQFVVHVRGNTGITATLADLYRIYELDTFGLIINTRLDDPGNPTESAALQLPHPGYGGGFVTHTGQRRMVIIGPWSGLSPETARGTEFEITGLPGRSVFYVGRLAVA